MNAYDINTRIADEGRVPLVPLVHVHELVQDGAVMEDENVRVTANIESRHSHIMTGSHESSRLPNSGPHERIIDLYERRAGDYDRDRSRSLQEKGWLDLFLQRVRPIGTVLDLGCGMGEPVGRYLLDQGYQVVGVDSSATLIALCRTRFPHAEWLVGDMRCLDLGRRFDGILAWDSFFHLSMDDQRGMFARFAAHAIPGAPLMFTSGTSEGEAIGSYRGEPLYHASLAPQEYRDVVAKAGFVVQAHRAEDPDCGGHTIWLATFGPGLNWATGNFPFD